MSDHPGYDNPDCHYGDHNYGTGATCKQCGHFNAGLLSWLRFEKAEREGRAHVDHFHNTPEKAAACAFKNGRLYAASTRKAISSPAS